MFVCEWIPVRLTSIYLLNFNVFHNRISQDYDSNCIFTVRLENVFRYQYQRKSKKNSGNNGNDGEFCIRESESWWVCNYPSFLNFTLWRHKIAFYIFSRKIHEKPFSLPTFFFLVLQINATLQSQSAVRRLK